jgi:hypothetical protein
MNEEQQSILDVIKNEAYVIRLKNGNYWIKNNKKTISTTPLLKDAKFLTWDETDLVLTQLGDWDLEGEIIPVMTLERYKELQRHELTSVIK